MALIDDLIAWYDLAEASGNAIDAHGSNDLTDNNTVGTDADGRDFERSNSEDFSIADNADFSVGDIDFSFAMVFKKESVDFTRGTLFYKGDGGETPYMAYETSGAVRFDVSSGSGFANQTSVDAAAGSLFDTSLHHFACGHDSANNQIWAQLDGGTRVTQAYTHGSYDDAKGFYIGSEFSSQRYWDGVIGKFGFWKRYLTSDEVIELWNAGDPLGYDDLGGGGGATAVPILIGGKLVNSGTLLTGLAR